MKRLEVKIWLLVVFVFLFAIFSAKNTVGNEQEINRWWKTKKTISCKSESTKMILVLSSNSSYLNIKIFLKPQEQKSIFGYTFYVAYNPQVIQFETFTQSRFIKSRDNKNVLMVKNTPV